MAYVPVDGSHWAWYVGLEREKAWRVTECWDITQEQLLGLVDIGSSSSLAR